MVVGDLRRGKGLRKCVAYKTVGVKTAKAGTAKRCDRFAK